MSAPKSEHSNMSTPTRKEFFPFQLPYLGAKTRERAVEKIATGAGVPRELSATSALGYGVSTSFETDSPERASEIRTSHRMGSCRLEDQTNSTSWGKLPLLVTVTSLHRHAVSCHRQCPQATLTSTTRRNPPSSRLCTTVIIALATVLSVRFLSSRPVFRSVSSRSPLTSYSSRTTTRTVS